METSVTSIKLDCLLASMTHKSKFIMVASRYIVWSSHLQANKWPTFAQVIHLGWIVVDYKFRGPNMCLRLSSQNIAFHVFCFSVLDVRINIRKSFGYSEYNYMQIIYSLAKQTETEVHAVQWSISKGGPIHHVGRFPWWLHYLLQMNQEGPCYPQSLLPPNHCDRHRVW